MIPNSTPAARKQTHVLAPLTRPSGPKFHRRNPRKIGQIPGKSYRVPTPVTTLLLPHTLPSLHQYNPCRGSSIGRACGSYNSKEINLKVVGSSPTFGYSYHTSSTEGSCSFAFCLFDHAGRFFALPSISVASQANSTIVPYNVRSSLASCMSFLLTRNQPSLGGLSLSSNQGTVTATTISDGCGNNDMKS